VDLKLMGACAHRPGTGVHRRGSRRGRNRDGGAGSCARTGRRTGISSSPCSTRCSPRSDTSAGAPSTRSPPSPRPSRRDLRGGNVLRPPVHRAARPGRPRLRRRRLPHSAGAAPAGLVRRPGRRRVQPVPRPVRPTSGRLRAACRVKPTGGDHRRDRDAGPPGSTGPRPCRRPTSIRGPAARTGRGRSRVDLDAYRSARRLRRRSPAIEMGPGQRVIAEIKASGCGAAAVPPSRPGSSGRASGPARRREVRHLQRRRVRARDLQGPGPHGGRPVRPVEAITIAGLTVGAETGFVYVRGEYPVATRRLRMPSTRPGRPVCSVTM
jgi:hypothetical protein